MEVRVGWISASTHPLGAPGTTFTVHSSLDLGFLGAAEEMTLQKRERTRCKLPGQGNCGGRGLHPRDGTLQNSCENAHKEGISAINVLPAPGS